VSDQGTLPNALGTVTECLAVTVATSDQIAGGIA
jgi:hypothetical protein